MGNWESIMDSDEHSPNLRAGPKKKKKSLASQIPYCQDNVTEPLGKLKNPLSQPIDSTIDATATSFKN